MIFLWTPRNVDHIGKHRVETTEASFVVAHASAPYPEAVGDEKLRVWGATESGRHLQVIFVYAAIEDVEPEEFEHLELQEKIALHDGELAIRVIHARDLNRDEKRQLRRRRRGRRP